MKMFVKADRKSSSWFVLSLNQNESSSLLFNYQSKTLEKKRENKKKKTMNSKTLGFSII